MKNQYAGDVGDFGKYGLLRKIAECGVSLAVIWYLTEDDGRTDGRHIQYLNPKTSNNKRFEKCDPILFQSMDNIVSNGRSMAAVRAARILPEATVYCEEEVPENHVDRELWFQQALKEVQGADLVFVDPDNGLMSESIRNSRKHVAYNEIRQLYSQGHNLLIYHHLSRQGDAASQAEYLRNKLHKELSAQATPTVLQYHRGTSRFFISVCQGSKSARIQAAVNSMAESDWKNHFSKI